MTDQDRELLELAAKAAGYAKGETFKFHPATGRAMVRSAIGERWSDWNPLTNSADAFELAARLTIDVSHNHPADQQPYVAAERRGCEGVFGPVCCIEDEFDECNRVAATRRAITRAAAEIGKAMT